MKGSRKRQAVPTAVGLLVLAWAVPLAWIGATPITNACEEAVPQPDELGESDSHASLWPPGVRCISRFADGRELEGTYVTWYELTVAVLLAIGVWLFCATFLRVVPLGQSVRGFLVATVIFLTVSAVFYF